MNDFLFLLQNDKPGDALCDYLQKDLVLIPSFLEKAEKIPAGPYPYHCGSVLEHLSACMNAVSGDPVAAWMAMTHDAGKLTTPEAIWPHHYGHELRGNVLAWLWAKQLNLGEPFLSSGCLSALLHMKAGRYPILRPGKKFRLLHEVHATPYAEAFWKVVDADTHSQISQTALQHWQKLIDAQKAGLSLNDQFHLLK